MAKWSLSSLWGKSQILAKAEVPLEINTTPTIPHYDWGTNKTVDVDITRGLYYNRLNRYALSAFLCKPMINSNVSFIGTPVISGAGSEFLKGLSIPYTEVHTMAERDGDCFVWPQWDIDNETVKFVIIPPEKITKTYTDPKTKKVLGYKIEETFRYNAVGRDEVHAESVFIITENRWRHVYKSDVESFDKSGQNPLGFLPIVHFSNSRESHEERGHSEYENLLPQLKLYHDMTFDAGHAQHTDGHPKIAIEGVEDVESFFVNNFGVDAAERIKNGESVSMDSKDLFITTEGTVKYLQRGTPTGDFRAFSEIVFTQIVEGSETPEVNFGANMGTSLASVKEQRPVWVKKIERKQKQYSKGTGGEGWEKLLANAIRISNEITFSAISEDFSLTWPPPDFKDELDNAQVVERMSNAIEKLKKDGALGDEEIYETLKQYNFLQLKDTVANHKKDVENSVKTNDNTGGDNLGQKPEEGPQDQTGDEDGSDNKEA